MPPATRAVKWAEHLDGKGHQETSRKAREDRGDWEGRPPGTAEQERPSSPTSVLEPLHGFDWVTITRSQAEMSSGPLQCGKNRHGRKAQPKVEYRAIGDVWCGGGGGTFFFFFFFYSFRLVLPNQDPSTRVRVLFGPMRSASHPQTKPPRIAKVTAHVMMILDRCLPFGVGEPRADRHVYRVQRHDGDHGVDGVGVEGPPDEEAQQARVLLAAGQGADGLQRSGAFFFFSGVPRSVSSC